MSGNVQKRNDQMVDLLKADFETRYRAQSHPGNIVGAVESDHRAFDGSQGGGGPLMYGWLADRSAISTYIGSQQLTGINIAFSDFLTSDNGGPYVDLDGTEALYIVDAAWEEVGAEEFFVWGWCNPASLAATITIASKYDTNGNNCSWRLIFDSVTGNFQFIVNTTGNPANDVAVDVAYTEVIDTWYFVAGYYLPSTFTRVWVGAASDGRLTPNDQLVGIPANLFNGTAPLSIGTSFNNAPTMLNGWNGLLGIGGARVNVQPGVAAAYDEVSGFAANLFNETRWFYLE